MKLFVISTPKLTFAVRPIGVALALAWLPTAADAQGFPAPNPTDNATHLSASASQLDLGSNFLQRLGREATYGYVQRDNPGGGGASQSTAAPIYRSWFEAYGTSARTDAQGTFVGDKRKTVGGVAGIGLTVAPGFNLGVSVDQSHTDIDAPLVLQSGKLDLTQIGINGSYTKGLWTLAFAAVHGFASVDSQRLTSGGFALANYRGSIDGALAELSYYKAFDQSRIVPKLGIEYVSASTNAFQESGGTFPASVAPSQGDRARVLIGAELGHYWIAGQQIIDVSGYGKFIDNFSQNIGTVDVTLGGSSIAVQGIRESAQGADAGAGLSWMLTNTARLYANYDGKYRSTFTSHQGTLGFELKW